ncbi:MAG: hypothetical protein U0894_06005 [Pirellulales bacterium]
MRALRKKLRTYAKKYRRQTQGGNKEGVEPFDAEAAAKEAGAAFGQTELVDRFEVKELELGQQAMRFDFQAAQMGGAMFQQFSDFAFIPDLPFYEVDDCDSSTGAEKYLYWHTAEEAEVEQTFAQAKPAVVKFWKQQKAFALAEKEAKEIAEKVTDGKSLKDVVADKTKVLTPPAFTWMTRGASPFGGGRPTLSQVVGVELAGDDFMKSVFSTPVGKATVAPDQSNTIAYVVCAISEEPELKIRREMFASSLRGQGSSALLELSIDSHARFYNELYQQWESENKIQWHRSRTKYDKDR